MIMYNAKRFIKSLQNQSVAIATTDRTHMPFKDVTMNKKYITLRTASHLKI